MHFDESQLRCDYEGWATLVTPQLSWFVNLRLGYATCQPAGTFVVDDILYRCADGYTLPLLDQDDIESVDTVRSMISLEEDGGGLARLFYNSPPTEEELDHWVSTGQTPEHPKHRRS